MALDWSKISMYFKGKKLGEVPDLCKWCDHITWGEGEKGDDVYCPRMEVEGEYQELIRCQKIRNQWCKNHMPEEYK